MDDFSGRSSEVAKQSLKPTFHNPQPESTLLNLKPGLASHSSFVKDAYHRPEPDYSFRKLPNIVDTVKPVERPSDSSEKRPASPISGLNDRMRAIEEKINKYKQENKAFEKQAFRKPPGLPLQTTSPKVTDQIDRLNRSDQLEDESRLYQVRPTNSSNHLPWFAKKSVPEQVVGIDHYKNLVMAEKYEMPQETPRLETMGPATEQMTPTRSISDKSFNLHQADARDSKDAKWNHANKRNLGSFNHLFPDLHPQPTFGERDIIDNDSNKFMKPQVHATSSTSAQQTEMEVKRLEALVTAQRKMIGEMQTQLKHERQMRLTSDSQLRHQSEQMPTIERISNLSSSEKGNNELDRLYESFVERQKEWNKFKNKMVNEVKRLPLAGCGDDLQTGISQSLDADSQIKMNAVPGFTRSNSKKKSFRSRSKGKMKKQKGNSSFNSTSRVSTRSINTRSLMIGEKTKRPKSAQGRPKLSNKTKSSKAVKPLARKLSLGSTRNSALNKSAIEIGKKTKGLPSKTKDKEKKAKEVLYKIVQKNPKEASKLINQLAEMVSLRLDAVSNIPLKHNDITKSKDKNRRKPF